MNNESTELTRAVYPAQSATEVWKAGGRPTAGGDGYTVSITPLEQKDGLSVCEISILKGETVVYILKEVASYE